VTSGDRPGLHVERTHLAWQRAALAALLLSSANLVLTARLPGTVAALISVVATLLAAAALWRTVPRRRSRRNRENVDGKLPESPFSRLVWSASAVIALALAALVGVVNP